VNHYVEISDREVNVMTSLKLGTGALDFTNPNGLVRPAIEKFAGAWLACFVVMAHGDFANALSLDHARLASICGTIGALVAVALLAHMDRTTNSLSRQMTISAFATFIGDVFAHPSHFPPQWGEPLITAVVSAVIAVAVWQAKRLVFRNL
jgi:uncharacterized membrane protein YeaQ/YmgE (transglycosylase-associated protein family)